MITDLHDQVGMDLAKHASDKASKAMLDALSLCDTPAQASMVGFRVLAVIAAQACGAMTKHHCISIEGLSSADMLELMATIMREIEERPA